VVRVPTHAAPGVNPLLLAIKEADEPLASKQVLNLSPAPFVDPNDMLNCSLRANEP